MIQRQLRELHQRHISTNISDLCCVHSFYLGKKVAFVYRAQREIRGTKIRVIWGKITRTHGTQRDKHCAKLDSVTNIMLQAIPALLEHNSDTTFLPSHSVPQSGLCYTHPRFSVSLSGARINTGSGNGLRLKWTWERPCRTA